MSKNETPMIHAYWDTVGGTLIEEFPAVRSSKHNSRRLLDGVIVCGGEKRIARRREVSLEGMDVIVIQAKAKRLGMYLMGQTLFSAKLMERFKPKSIRSVALCTKTDSELEPLLMAHEGMEVVAMPQFERPRRRRRKESR